MRFLFCPIGNDRSFFELLRVIRRSPAFLRCRMAISIEIREIDISKPARALRFLRMTDYPLVILCGSWLLNLLALAFVEPEMRRGGEFVCLALKENADCYVGSKSKC